MQELERENRELRDSTAVMASGASVDERRLSSMKEAKGPTELPHRAFARLAATSCKSAASKAKAVSNAIRSSMRKKGMVVSMQTKMMVGAGVQSTACAQWRRVR